MHRINVSLCVSTDIYRHEARPGEEQGGREGAKDPPGEQRDPEKARQEPNVSRHFLPRQNLLIIVPSPGAPRRETQDPLLRHQAAEGKRTDVTHEPASHRLLHRA